MSTSNKISAVEFPTATRLHVAVAVRDVAAALPFYRTLFGQEPTKLREDYAKFEVLDPPVNFSLNASAVGAGHGAGPQHFGIQVKSTDAVEIWKSRVEAAGFAVEVEFAVTCCYAVQDKFWAVDPDGHRWEIFVVTQADAAVHSENRTVAAPACCPQPDNSTVAAPAYCPQPDNSTVAAPACCPPSEPRA
ncbi:MAG: VOC family protein [Myxococcales bacterium]|nr:VOC family protein [Myxococcales bacterium]